MNFIENSVHWAEFLSGFYRFLRLRESLLLPKLNLTYNVLCASVFETMTRVLMRCCESK